MADNKYDSINKINIPDPTALKNKMTAIGSIAIDGTTAYVLKSCGKSSDNTQYPVVLYKVSNLTSSPRLTLIQITKSGKCAKLAKHANGMCYVKKSGDKNGYLYIGTMNDANKPQLYKVNTKGEVKKEIYYIKNGERHTFTGFDCVGEENGKLKFILSSAGSNNRRKFEYALLDGSNLVYTGVTFYSQPVDGTANDIYFNRDKKKLYVIMFRKDSKGNIKYNDIYSYNDADKCTNGQQLSPANIHRVNAPSKYTKFEIEGMVMSGSSKYIVCNCDSGTANLKSDGVFKLKKK